jgi:SAM-dependent methyltransferase
MPTRYPHGHHESVLRAHRWRTAANSAAYLLPHLRPGMSLLDVGCGPGTITAELAALVAPGRVTAVEVSPQALELAREELAGRGVAGVEFVLGDVHALDLPAGAFDVVHAHQVLQHLAHPVAALAEMRRVCRPGGLVAARDADYAAMTWFPSSPGLDRWLELYQALARAGGGEPDAGRRLRSWASAAGFAEITSSAAVWCFASTEDLAWWTGTWAERVTSSTFAEQAVARGLSGTAELESLAQAWRQWGEQPGAWFSVLHGEVLAHR